MKLETVVMNYETWASIPQNPIQRNTEAHAKKASLNHLKNNSVTQTKVSAAITNDGKFYKLDGHTRTYLWEKGHLKKPNFLNVDLYHVDDEKQVIELYKQFDNSFAAETARDKTSGFFNLQNYQPQSTLINSVGISQALKLISGKYGKSFDIYEEGSKWIEEIKLIDSYGLGHQYITSGTFAAMLMTVRIYKNKAMDFFVRLEKNDGYKHGNERDAVFVLCDVIKLLRIQKRLSGEHNSKIVCEKTLSAFENWRENKIYTHNSRLKNITLETYKEKYKKELMLKESTKEQTITLKERFFKPLNYTEFMKQVTA